jgi:predicted nucleotidyltransferase
VALSLSSDECKIVEDILSRLVPELEVWAFGSRASGRARTTSDLDLAVITESPLPFSRLGELEEAFSVSGLPFRVDVVDWAVCRETFRELIRKERVVIRAVST